MKMRSAKFVTSAKDLATCPPSKLPEFAFIGRSNVGKSSLINLLTGEKDLAKVSKMPGKTRLINFFAIDQAWTLVDLPGYGYAKVGQSEQGDFNEAASHYLAERENLKGIFALVDSRLEPKPIDLQFFAWAQETCVAPVHLVFTKIDKVAAGTRQDNESLFVSALKELGLSAPKALRCSATERLGRGDILRVIEQSIPKAALKKAKKTVSIGWMK